MKKLQRILTVALSATIAVSSAGCSKKNADKSGDKTKISFSFWEPGTGKELEEALNAVKAGYEKEHPETEVEIIAQPVSGYQEWIKAQLAANNAPEIESNHCNLLMEQYASGVIETIKEEYNKATPYSNGTIWKDTFTDIDMDRAHNLTYDATYAVPFFTVGTAVYYNKDIYKKLNLSVPKTWDEFMSNCEKISKANITPIAMAGQDGSGMQWVLQQATVGLCGQRILADENLNFNGDCTISNPEIAKAVDSGYFNFNTNAEYKQLYLDCIDKVKEYLKYCPDASGFDESAIKTIFLSGNAAHIYSGSWDLQGILLNDSLNFEVGTFSFPKFTKENGKWAGNGVSYDTTQPVAITKTSSPEKRAAAIDFLQYFTSKDVYSDFIAKAFQIPVLKDVDADPVFDGFMNSNGYPANGLFHFGSDKYASNAWQTAVALISDPNIKFTDELFAKMQEAMEARSEELKETYNYGPDNDYGISELSMSGGKFVPEQ